MTVTRSRLPVLCATAALAVALAGCGGTTSSAGAPPAPPATSAAEGGAGTAAAGAKVSANTASEDEIADALEQAGVSSPSRWAEEVVEYRPYPADDPNLTKLRDNLAKYNPGQETTDKIVSALTP